MEIGHFILDGHEVVACSIDKWAKQLGDRDYGRVDKTVLPSGSIISTVFLGLDHSFGEGAPLLFESMYFPHQGPDDDHWREEDCERCSTWEQAEKQHATMVAKYKGD